MKNARKPDKRTELRRLHKRVKVLRAYIKMGYNDDHARPFPLQLKDCKARIAELSVDRRKFLPDPNTRANNPMHGRPMVPNPTPSTLRSRAYRARQKAKTK